MMPKPWKVVIEDASGSGDGPDSLAVYAEGKEVGRYCIVDNPKQERGMLERMIQACSMADLRRTQEVLEAHKQANIELGKQVKGWKEYGEQVTRAEEAEAQLSWMEDCWYAVLTEISKTRGWRGAVTKTATDTSDFAALPPSALRVLERLAQRAITYQERTIGTRKGTDDDDKHGAVEPE